MKPGRPERWCLADATPAGIERTIDALLSIAAEELPASLGGTPFDPTRLGGLQSRVVRLFDTLDSLDSTVASASVPDLIEVAGQASLTLEPLVVRVLARAAPEKLHARASGRVDLSRLLVDLHEVGLSPFEPSLLTLASAAFRDAVESDGWSALSWALWQVLGDRIDAAHAAPLLDVEKAREMLWSAAAVVLSVAERAAHLLDVAEGRLPSRYRAIRKLGAGGMGEVFLAVDRHTDSKRAVKVLRHAQLDSPVAVASLRREAKALSQMTSPRVVRYFDTEEFRGTFAIAMAFVEGDTLQHELDTLGRVPLAAAVNTTIEVLSALEDIHLENLVHRDIKPSNLIRTPAGIVVIDFGLAQRAGENHTLPLRMGSHRYVAPEQHEGSADHRSDLYAAGRVLYALLAGSPPAHDTDPLPEEITTANGAVARAYEKATHRDPANRFQTAAEMREALRLALENRGSSEGEAFGLSAGQRWGPYLVEHEVDRSKSRTWSLVRVHAHERRFARPKLLWVHHALAEAERGELLDLGNTLSKATSAEVQQLDEIVDQPEIGLLFADRPPMTLATVLKRCAERGKRISPPVAVRIAYEIARGLDALEGEGLPWSAESGASSSERRGRRMTPRLWPMAVRLSPEPKVELSPIELYRDAFEPGAPALPLGLLRYRAPEHLLESALAPGLARSSSVYAVALMLWECLVGSQAFPGSDPDRVRREITERGPSKLSALGVTVPAPLEGLVARALSRAPEARPRSAGELARELMDLEEHAHRSRDGLQALVTEAGAS